MDHLFRSVDWRLTAPFAVELDLAISVSFRIITGIPAATFDAAEMRYVLHLPATLSGFGLSSARWSTYAQYVGAAALVSKKVADFIPDETVGPPLPVASPPVSPAESQPSAPNSCAEPPLSLLDRIATAALWSDRRHFSLPSLGSTPSSSGRSPGSILHLSHGEAESLLRGTPPGGPTSLLPLPLLTRPSTIVTCAMRRPAPPEAGSAEGRTLRRTMTSGSRAIMHSRPYLRARASCPPQR